jgi:hypothetical protein
MTETTKTDPAAEAQKATESQAKADPNAAKVLKAAKAAPKIVKYVSTNKHSTLIDIQIKGEMMYGYWAGTAGGYVGWDIPAELAEYFELHHHFVVGNVKRAEAEPEKK